MAKDNTMIIAKLAKIQAEVDAIAKARKNQQQGYSFRGVEDVLNMMHGLLALNQVLVITRKVGVGLVEERATRSGGTQIYRVNDYEFDFIAIDGSKVTVGPIPGEGADSGDKAANKTLANAYKYCMFLTFSIPTQGLVEEPDATTPEPSNAPTNGGHAEQQSGQNGGNNGGTYQEQRKRFDDLLAQGNFDEKEVKQAKAMASKINPKDVKSLENLINAFEKKKSAREGQESQDPPKESMTPEQVADAVQGELIEDPASEDYFEDDIPF